MSENQDNLTPRARSETEKGARIGTGIRGADGTRSVPATLGGARNADDTLDGTRSVPATLGGARNADGTFDGTRSVPATLAGAVIIAACVLLAYYPCLHVRGAFILDDDLLLTDNYIVKTPDGLSRFWFTAQASEYYPVTNTMFWIEWRIWGLNPAGYRAVNIGIHIISSFLIWFILRKLSIPGAFLAALIFAVHPVNVESVAWIAQLRNVLAMFFFLLSIWCYLRGEMARHTSPWRRRVESSHGGPWEPETAPARSHGGPWEPEIARESSHGGPWERGGAAAGPGQWYWLSLGAFILAMLSKGSAAVLPAALLGIIWWLRPLVRRDFVRTAPFFVVAAVLTLVNIWFQTHGSGEVVRHAGLVERLLGAGGVVWFYLYKAVLPFDICFIYPQWRINAGSLLWWLPLLAAMAVTAVLWRHRKGWGRPYLFAWGYFCVALVPVLGLIDVYFMKYSPVADHYQHIAIIGVIALAAAGCEMWQRKGGKSFWAASAVAVAAAGTLVTLTWRQTSLYGDAIRLYEATREKNPQCCMVHELLGGAFRPSRAKTGSAGTISTGLSDQTGFRRGK